ncbi:uncharacterized protein LOC112595604 [Melanaphis sacchari]|uniref:uncharacterized protein LOC112595604 n=1 Tax=Melanaphis sacchari TaxID=742174 RepID=UPI000DC14182|nr:uncharacterized protein LOC112595604 [Melanaphis sacchari]
MEENSKVEVVTVTWYSYLSQIIVGLLSLFALKIIYFTIKRRYTQTSKVEKNSTEESKIYTSSENVFNESSTESLNLELEEKYKLLRRSDKRNESSGVLCTNDSELSKLIDTEDDIVDKLLSELINFDTKLDFKRTIDTVFSGYDSTQNEMQECKNYRKFQDVVDTCKINSDSHSSILSWKSCHKNIDHSESDYINNSENLEICQPVNLCIKDNNNETETNKKTIKTFFTDRKYKNTKDLLMINPEDFPFAETIANKQLSANNHDELENEDNLNDTEHFSNYHNELEAEYNSESLKHGLENEYDLNDTELSTINYNASENEYSLENTKYSLNEDELMLEKNLETTEISSINQDESLYEYNLKSPELSSLNNDKSISGIDSPNIHDYDVQSITDLNNTSSTEFTESLPSPIYQNNNSIDDIRYVEDFNDISFFDPTLSDDAMNEAFVED